MSKIRFMKSYTYYFEQTLQRLKIQGSIFQNKSNAIPYSMFVSMMPICLLAMMQTVKSGKMPPQHQVFPNFK